MNKLKLRLSNHEMFATLFRLKGNPKLCVFLEPLWGIPYALYIPFATLYMYELGVKDQQIGLLLTVGMILQVFASLLGGVVTDKLGRRLTTVIFDLLSWSAPSILLIFAQNFWWFAAATMLNSFWQITNNSWTCLLVEDCDPKELVNVYTWVSISMLLAVFFAPISSFFINEFSVVTTMRVLYAINFVSMTAKFLLLFKYGKETEQGKIRMKETKHISMTKMFVQYRDIFMLIIKSPATILALVLKVIINITGMTTANFFALYTTKNLGFPDYLMGWFPIARAAIMLIFIFGAQHKINKLKFKPVMVAGTILYILSNIVLLLTTSQNYVMILTYVIIDAFAYTLLIPRYDSVLAIFVDPQQRARVLGLIYVITIGFSMPFGSIVGIMSSVNRALPFIFNVVLYGICLVLVIVSKTLKNHDSEN